MNPDANEPQDEQQGMPQAPQTGDGSMPQAPTPTVPPQEDVAEDTPEVVPPQGDTPEEETPPLDGDKDDDGGKW